MSPFGFIETIFHLSLFQLQSVHQQAVDEFNARLAERASEMELIQAHQDAQLQEAEDRLKREKTSRSVTFPEYTELAHTA